MPFAGYEDFADCVARNTDKANPQAYCAAIQQQVEKLNRAEGFRIAKLDEDQNLVFGWASVVMKAGDPLEDLQGDVIDPADLEHAAYEFVLEFRDLDEMHDGVSKGVLVESLVVTEEKLTAMGLAKGALEPGWWTGWKVDPATFQKVKAGTLMMFSIEGTGVREAA